jgi:branched-chain amino acid transport system permease protein
VDRFIALLASGLSLGAVIGLVAVGLLVVQKASGVTNFAHGDLVTLGTYLAIWSIGRLSLPVAIAYLLALVAMFGVGVAIERVAYAPLRTRSPMTIVIATLAASVTIEGLIAVWQGSDPKPLPSIVDNGSVRVLGANVSHQQLLIIGVSAVAIGAVLLAFQRTSFGRQLRAMSSDPETARLFGLRTRRLTMAAFGLSGTLACLAGILVAPQSAADNTFGFRLMVLAFAAAVLGGFGSLGGVVVGALIIGLVQQLVGGYVLTDYASALPFVVMFAVIAVRPAGLFSTQAERL